MSASINSLGQSPQLRLPAGPPEIAGRGETAPVSFQDLLLQSVEQVNTMQTDAEGAVERSLVGDDLTMVEAFSSVKKADLALRMLLQVRNKVLEAYNEIQQLRM